MVLIKIYIKYLSLLVSAFMLQGHNLLMYIEEVTAKHNSNTKQCLNI